MRTEPSKVLRQFLRKRIEYIRDADGSHDAKGLKVSWYCKGVGHPHELMGVADRLKGASRGRRGPRRKYVAYEFSAHPSDRQGAKRAFRNLAEMERVAAEIAKEFGAVYYLVGFHGLQDVHVLVLNWGPTGLALKSYLPNRSNPRRVLVAVCDRVERELNLERQKGDAGQLLSMDEVRQTKRRERGRRPLHEQIADRLAENVQTPTIAEILEAIAACGWNSAVAKNRLSISFSPERPSAHYDLDLFRRGLNRVCRNRKKEKEHGGPDYEALTAAVTRFMQTGKCEPKAAGWLVFEGDGTTSSRSVRMKADLEALVVNATSEEAVEFRAVIAAAAAVRSKLLRPQRKELSDPDHHAP